MNDKQAIIVFIGMLYAAFVLLSIFVMIDVPEELERNPGLINTKSKRALWILSCLLLVPLFIIASRGPRSIFCEIKEFIIGVKDNGKGNDNA